MKCQKCGTPNEAGATGCSNCGGLLIDPDAPEHQLQRVKIVDIDMPFMSMVNFLAKLTLAAIPAAIVAAVIVVAIGAILGMLMRH